jgi:HEAT repeat protein
MFWRAGTTREHVERWTAYAIGRVAEGPRKIQYFLDGLAGVWSPPESLHYCLGGSVHWQVPASAEGVEQVARFVADERPGVRHAAVAALRRALADEDARVRLLAGRAASGLGLGQALRGVLERAGTDPVWTVRWYAARALLAIDVDLACKLLVSSAPRPGSAAVETWLACARAVPAPILELRSLMHSFVGTR